MSKKLSQRLKSFFKPLKSSGHIPPLEQTRKEKLMKESDLGFGLAIGERDEDVYRRNTQKLEVTRLEQERDAINKNLVAQHRIMIATFAAVVVALVSTVAAVCIAIFK